jgi:osmotically-inducible protein OsmY
MRLLLILIMKSLFIFVLGLTLGAYGMYRYNENKPQELYRDQVKRVRIVEDDLKKDIAKVGEVVKEKAADAGVVISDTKILATIKAKFALDRELNSLDIKIKVDHGNVSLNGYVSNEALMNKMTSLVFDTEGVKQVRAHLSIK